MIFKQYYLGCLAHASYLIADEDSRVAAIVDPQRDVDQYVDEAVKQGIQIRYVLLTHQHADFIAGHLELRERVGAAIVLGARAQAEYDFTPLHDGDTIRLGANVVLQALETPGHTPESICILVFNGVGTDPKPPAVLTGDTLFVNDVGRPDLRASLGWLPQDLAAMLYDSLHGKLLPLPDATRVYPAHGAGSLCGKALGPAKSTTIGAERRGNYALQPMSKQKFVGLLTADQPAAPPYFTLDAVWNTKERPTLEQALEKSLVPLDLEAVLRLQDEGAQLLDVNSGPVFAAAHLRSSLNIGLDGLYATWAGTLLDSTRPIVVIAEPGREYEATMRLGRIGFDGVAGYLANGIRGAASHLLQRTERISPEDWAWESAQPSPPFLLDVRASSEWEQSRIEGSANIPLNHLGARMAELPHGRRVVVHCAGGYRSSIAASLLKLHGFKDVADLAGGIAAWLADQNNRLTSEKDSYVEHLRG